jgi:hypothetical protein
MYMGWLQLITTIFVDSEGSPIRQFPIQMNMVVDVIMGFILLVSPWLYTFADKNEGRAFIPALCFGSILLILGLFTKKSPFLTKTHGTVAEGQLTSLDSTEGRLNV